MYGKVKIQRNSFPSNCFLGLPGLLQHVLCLYIIGKVGPKIKPGPPEWSKKREKGSKYFICISHV